MKKVIIKSMVVLSLVMAGTFNTTTTFAQTQETEQVETPAERKAREKAEKKARKEAEKARKAREKEMRDSIKQAEKIAAILAAQKKDGSLNQESTTTTANLGEEWGAPEMRADNAATFSFFENAYKNREFDKALEYMQTLITNCPKARVNIYVYGAEIYRYKIARAQSMNEKIAHIESLMKLYDARLAAFADHKEYGEVYILKQKAKDYYQYRSDDKQGMLELFRKAIEIDPEVDAGFINQYFLVLVEEYQNFNVETDHFMTEYEFMASKMDLVTDEQEKKTFDALLITSGAADCNNLETIFSDRLANDPENAEQIEKAFKLMSRNQCQSEFYLSIAEKYYAIAPSTETAILVSNAYSKTGNNAKALEYLRAAMSSETDPMLKADLAVQIAATHLSNGSAREAANFAKQAVEFNDKNAMAYVILAQAYSQAGCGDAFAKQASYWLAYDMAAKARGLAEGNAELQSMCSQLMGSFRSCFPKQSDCFFRGLQDGQSYYVNCGWVAGNTSVRSLK